MYNGCTAQPLRFLPIALDELDAKKLAALVRWFAAGGMTIALFFVIMTPIWERKTIVSLSQIGNFTQKEAMKWQK
ncbi:hypothetical protein [Ktedonobacter robiniae]|uniref:Uncharacterized protein n=1 Tax=Ktedonobacter robiniae TaxID=2778365 RepID=A0ABQ3UNW4_9CHLR|nr:hypothetical protein [Ktedonobacter robiniae]GHO54411.1 hypothetical protein KSB_28860 [Ktedonobacter robiniae]